MWLHHLTNFIGTVLAYFISAIGTTLMGIVLGVVLAASTGIASLRRINKIHGRAAMLKHWEEDAKVAARIGLICAACIYGPVLIWKTGQAVLDDHMGLVLRSQGQRALIAGNSRGLEEVKSDDLRKYNDLRVSCAQTSGANGTLQSQNRDQQNLIAGCQEDAIKRLSPDPQRTTSLVWEDDVTNGVDHKRSELILTNRTMVKPYVQLFCNVRIKSAKALIMGSVVQSGGADLSNNSQQIDIHFVAPDWTASTPIRLE